MSLATDLIQKIKIGGSKLLDTAGQSVGTASEFVRKNPVTSAVSVSGGVLAGVTAVQIIRKKRKASTKAKKSKRKVSKAKPRKRKSTSKKRKSKQKKPYTARKGKDTSTRRIRFTKNNQPYVILKSGKARFIKKSSVARMRKIKGGKY